ncbi:Protein CBG19169 [Caenorhabditis briggsae]|uniref:Protein CBG19169 n=1 Tax=Caenorhabditis briggsae TaxID=6238 RepID=A8XUZ9_CAEBR|nr:Protein CBG19169 [Caenorhabditis briggsae]CAP36466.1 Protein CBG19169 [Caenorhabditis briggsae]
MCKICGLDAHGVHFGVTTCRACAAFFRRFVVLNLEYDCLKDKSKCSLDKIRRSSCRHCRFQKCIRMGMTADNVQWNRDVYSTDGRKIKSPELKKVKSPEINYDDKSYLNIVLPSTSQPIANLYSVIKTQKLAISCERAIQLDALFFDIEGVAQNKLKVTLQDYKTFAQRCVEEVAKPLSQLKLSIEEVAFLIVNFVFHNEEKIIGESFDVCDAFRDSIANDLHEYYRKNNIINYASRISKMMNTIAAMKKIHYDDLGGTFTANARNSVKEEVVEEEDEEFIKVD